MPLVQIVSPGGGAGDLTGLAANARLPSKVEEQPAMLKNKHFVVSLVALGALLLLSGPAFAHHGSAAYDMSKTITVTGTVTEFQYINPHVLITMDVKNPTTG